MTQNVGRGRVLSGQVGKLETPMKRSDGWDDPARTRSTWTGRYPGRLPGRGSMTNASGSPDPVSHTLPLRVTSSRSGRSEAESKRGSPQRSPRGGGTGPSSTHQARHLRQREPGLATGWLRAGHGPSLVHRRARGFEGAVTPSCSAVLGGIETCAQPNWYQSGAASPGCNAFTPAQRGRCASTIRNLLLASGLRSWHWPILQAL